MNKYFDRSDGKRLEILYEPYCDICGEPIPESFSYSPYCKICRDMADDDKSLIKIRGFGKYKKWDDNDLLSKEIIKFKTNPDMCNILSECMFFAIEDMYPDLIESDIIIPIQSNCNEGFNPPALLAEKMSKRYNFRYLDCLIRNYPSVHKGSGFRERKRIIEGNIGCNARFNNEKILLVDDVCTTCQTLRESAKVLLRSGAKEVWGLVLARTFEEEHMDVLRRYNGY